MHLIAKASSRDEVSAAVADCADLSALWQANPAAWDTIKSVLAPLTYDCCRQRPEDWADLFDRIAEISPDAAAALYLFDTEQRVEATQSIVARLQEWQLLATGARVLDFGCGTGRLTEALAKLGHPVVGVDVSTGMLSAARRRCGGLDGVSLRAGDGRGLERLEATPFELVVACDVFPYVVTAGAAAVRDLLRAMSRSLVETGAVAVLNYSYRGDRARDRAEIELCACDAELTIVRASVGDFRHWDGETYILRKRA